MTGWDQKFNWQHYDINWKHCIKLREDRWAQILGEEMGWEPGRIYQGLRPNSQLRAALDQLIGKDRWCYQNKFTADADRDHLALWFTDQDDELTVRIWLALQDGD